jgi:hypothetical protein
MAHEFTRYITTRQLAKIIRQGKRTRAVYDWKTKGYIFSVRPIEGKGWGKSDEWDFPAAFWAWCLDELFEIGLTSDAAVYLAWLSDSPHFMEQIQPLLLKESEEIQRYLEKNDYETVIQLLRGFLPSGDRFSELHISTSEVFLERVSKACDYQEPMIGAANKQEVTSMAVIFCQQVRKKVLNRWLEVVREK